MLLRRWITSSDTLRLQEITISERKWKWSRRLTFLCYQRLSSGWQSHHYYHDADILHLDSIHRTIGHSRHLSESSKIEKGVRVETVEIWNKDMTKRSIVRCSVCVM